LRYKSDNHIGAWFIELKNISKNLYKNIIKLKPMFVLIKAFFSLIVVLFTCQSISSLIIVNIN